MPKPRGPSRGPEPPPSGPPSPVQAAEGNGLLSFESEPALPGGLLQWAESLQIKHCRSFEAHRFIWLSHLLGCSATEWLLLINISTRIIFGVLAAHTAQLLVTSSRRQSGKYNTPAALTPALHSSAAAPVSPAVPVNMTGAVGWDVSPESGWRLQEWLGPSDDKCSQLVAGPWGGRGRILQEYSVLRTELSLLLLRRHSYVSELECWFKSLSLFLSSWTKSSSWPMKCVSMGSDPISMAGLPKTETGSWKGLGKECLHTEEGGPQDSCASTWLSKCVSLCWMVIRKGRCVWVSILTFKFL